MCVGIHDAYAFVLLWENLDVVTSVVNGKGTKNGVDIFPNRHSIHSTALKIHCNDKDQYDLKSCVNGICEGPFHLYPLLHCS